MDASGRASGVKSVPNQIVDPSTVANPWEIREQQNGPQYIKNSGALNKFAHEF